VGIGQGEGWRLEPECLHGGGGTGHNALPRHVNLKIVACEQYSEAREVFREKQ
jgi:hypothetical protein